MPFNDELNAALEAARLAGVLILEAYRDFEPIRGAPASISTEVDRASQETILKYLRHCFPDDSLVAEEATATVLEAPVGRDRTWVVDPIDGTRGFVEKMDEFSVMVGLRDADGIVVGVVLEPVLERTTFAVRGEGCHVRVGSALEPVRCHVTSTETVDGCSLTQSHSKPGRPPSTAVRALSPGRIVETYSAGIKLAQVARGEVDVYVNSVGFKDWDICAGQILVEEAGGRMTCLNGEPIRYGGPGYRQMGGLIASNDRLHQAIIDRMA